MNPDLALVLGIVIGVLSFPAIISAFTESRPPRTGAMLLVGGGGLIAYAVSRNPTGYSLGDVPSVFGRVLQHYLM